MKDMVERELEARNQRARERAATTTTTATGTTTKAGNEGVTDAIVSQSLETAISDLEKTYGASGKGTLGKVFVIGGGRSMRRLCAVILGCGLRSGRVGRCGLL